MRKLSAWDFVALLGVVTACMATWSVYDQLPDPMPIHFDIHGKPNGWMPRAYGAWGMPVFATVLWGFMRVLPSILPQSDKKRLTPGSVPLVAMITTLFMAGVHIVILHVATTPNADVMSLVFTLIALMLVALGLVMPRLRRNPIMGIRTPWTLTSDENWARTHRVAGYSMVLGGILTGLCALLGGIACAIGGIIAISVSTLIPAVWSLVYARRAELK
jgi:uncharacterized membrane protein